MLLKLINNYKIYTKEKIHVHVVYICKFFFLLIGTKFETEKKSKKPIKNVNNTHFFYCILLLRFLKSFLSFDDIFYQLRCQATKS